MTGELLSLLVAKASQMGLTSPDTSPHRLEWTDISSALGWVDREIPRSSALLQYKYNQEEKYLGDIVEHLIYKTRTLNDDWQTDYYKSPLIYDTAKLALSEFVHNNLCLTCNGQGQKIIEGGEIIVCPGCEGHKIRKFRGHDQELGITPDQWNDWQERVYKPMMLRLWHIHDNGLSRLAGRLYG